MAPPASSNESNDGIEELVWLSPGRAPLAGKYRIERILAKGGMGVVLEARHVRVGQRVAIKVLGSGLHEHPELVRRFEREARAAGSLTSPHAVRVFDIDATEDGTPFIVMELLSGRDLSRVIDRDGPQPVARAARWLIEACDALAEAHQLGIVHRDIKPSNLFLHDTGAGSIVKVLDFGIAKHVLTGEAQITHAVAPLGTPHYMSPEQVRCAKDVDARTDVWSLGITLYELVCGTPPFAHESSSACIAAIAADPVPDPRTFRAQLGAEVVAVVMKALAKNAVDRYQSIAELVAALAPFADSDESLRNRSGSFAAASSRSSTPIVLDLGARVRRTATAPATASLLRGGRARAGLAFVSSAVVGFAVLVATPKCVSTSNDTTPASRGLAVDESAPWPSASVTAPPVVTASAAADTVAVSLPEPPPLMIPTPIAVAAPFVPKRTLHAAPAATPPRTARQVEKAMPGSALPAIRSGARGNLPAATVPAARVPRARVPRARVPPNRPPPVRLPLVR